MRLTAAMLFVLIAGHACEPSTAPNVPLTGVYSGNFTVSFRPQSVFQGTLRVTQHETEVSGGLTTTSGRSADVSGSVTGAHFTGTITFTDGCVGSASTTANITNRGRLVAGHYSAQDCSGHYTGSYSLTKE